MYHISLQKGFAHQTASWVLVILRWGDEALFYVFATYLHAFHAIHLAKLTP